MSWQNKQCLLKSKTAEVLERSRLGPALESSGSSVSLPRLPNLAREGDTYLDTVFVTSYTL